MVSSKVGIAALSLTALVGTLLLGSEHVSWTLALALVIAALMLINVVHHRALRKGEDGEASQ